MFLISRSIGFIIATLYIVALVSLIVKHFFLCVPRQDVAFLASDFFVHYHEILIFMSNERERLIKCAKLHFLGSSGEKREGNKVKYRKILHLKMVNTLKHVLWFPQFLLVFSRYILATFGVCVHLMKVN